MNLYKHTSQFLTLERLFHVCVCITVISVNAYCMYFGFFLWLLRIVYLKYCLKTSLVRYLNNNGKTMPSVQEIQLLGIKFIFLSVSVYISFSRLSYLGSLSKWNHWHRKIHSGLGWGSCTFEFSFRLLKTMNY